MSRRHMMQVCQKQGNKQWYDPQRDLAYCWKTLVGGAADGLAETRWEDWFKDYFLHVGLTEEEIGRAFQVYVLAMANFTKEEFNTPREAMMAAGWFDLPPAAQAALFLKLGQVTTCAFFVGIRDAMFDRPEVPKATDEVFRAAAADAQEQLGRRTWIPAWLRRLVRRWIA